MNYKDLAIGIKQWLSPLNTICIGKEKEWQRLQEIKIVGTLSEDCLIIMGKYRNVIWSKNKRYISKIEKQEQVIRLTIPEAEILLREKSLKLESGNYLVKCNAINIMANING